MVSDMVRTACFFTDELAEVSAVPHRINSVDSPSVVVAVVTARSASESCI